MLKREYKKQNIIELIQLAQNGEVKALEEFIRKIQSEVYAIFSHLVDKKDDISDLTQEALIKIAKSLYQLKDVKSYKSWQNRIITNVFNDYIRKKSNNEIEIDEEKLNKIKDEIGCEPGEKCLYIQIEKLIRAALLTLPQSLRVALILREYEGLSYQDIAKITNVTLGTVKSRISRARLKLQNELRDFL